MQFFDESPLFAAIRKAVGEKEEMLVARMSELRIDMNSILQRDRLVWKARTYEFLAVSIVACSIWLSVILLLLVILVAIFGNEPYVERIILLAYAAYVYLDHAPSNGGRPSAMFRRGSYWKYFRDYFPTRVIKQNRASEFSKDATYIVGYHPHGVSGLGAFAAFGGRYPELDEIFPDIELFGCTLESNFNVPILRECLLAMGGV
jgi:Diacylglycerol acyltransferase